MEALSKLVSRVQGGDLKSYNSIVHRFQDMAVGYAFSLMGDFHLAEDAALKGSSMPTWIFPNSENRPPFPAGSAKSCSASATVIHGGSGFRPLTSMTIRILPHTKRDRRNRWKIFISAMRISQGLRLQVRHADVRPEIFFPFFQRRTKDIQMQNWFSAAAGYVASRPS